MDAPGASVDREVCPFCGRIARGDVLRRGGVAASFPDGYPLTDGHTLVVPVRHVAALDDLGGEEFIAMWRAVRREMGRLRRELSPDGFNIGVNVGASAGQTVDHAHVHLIPRYHGDVADPRGGVRCVVPHKARYWEAP
ncbi:MAG: HIT family protein [Actinobacteria bacterium]|nr:HIT family protein [Actinomycetota bacterium]